MLHRRFGRTEIKIPVLSCGGMRYQQSWSDADRISPESQRNVEACIARALELGINHIETARGYGTSEAQLGQILPSVPRERIIVQAKVSPEADPAKFLETFERSMKRLRLDHVDLFALHGVNDETRLSWSLRKGGCLEAALELKRQGRVRAVGFSTHAPLPVIMAMVQDGRCDYVNLHWYSRSLSGCSAARGSTHGTSGCPSGRPSPGTSTSARSCGSTTSPGRST
ncbi:aldo/keto reductase [Sorangium sp. So ce429]